MSDENPFTRESRALKNALGSNVTRGLDPFATKSALSSLGSTIGSNPFATKSALGSLGSTIGSDPFATKSALSSLGSTIGSDPFATKSALSSLGSVIASDPFTTKSGLGSLGSTVGSDPFATKSGLGSLGSTIGSDPFATKSALGSLGGVSNAFAAARTTPIRARSIAPSHAPTPGATAPKAAPSVSRQQQESATKLSRAADLGSLVRSARKALALNQQEFADLAGVGRRFVSELESGKPSLEFDKVLRCCAAAGIDILAAPRRLA